MADYETLLIEDRGPVRIITVNRPEVLNALNERVVSELFSCLEGSPATRRATSAASS